MQLCLIEFSRPNNDTGLFLSESFTNSVSNLPIEEIILFQPTEQSCQPLQEELKRLFPDSILRLETLEPISTGTISSKIQQQPWQLLRTILSKLDYCQELLFVFGRGTGLHQHLMWLASEIRGSKGIYLDEPDVEINSIANSQIEADITKATLGAFAFLAAQEIIEKTQDKDGWVNSDDLAKSSGAISSGVNAATQIPLREGYIVKKETTSGNTIYKLTNKGWPVALESYAQSRSKDSVKDLLVSFARLPEIQIQSGNNPKPLNFFSHFAPSQPFDGLVVVLQKYAEEVEGSHIMTLDAACEFFVNTSFIGDLRGAKEILRQRCLFDSVKEKTHLVIINPNYNETFQLNFSKNLLSTLINFESEHGQYCWNFDITSPMNPIKIAVSIFSNASDAATSYILKSQGEPGAVIIDVDRSRHPRHSHKLSVPNRFALDAMKENHKDGYRNILVALMLLEDVMNDSVTNRLPFDDTPETHFDGVTWKEIENFVEDLKSPYDLSKGTLTGSVTRMKELIPKRLVLRHLPEEGPSKLRFKLTNEGYLVASQLYAEIKKEGGV